MVFVQRNGGTYLRRYVKPKDPRTAAQRDKRARFAEAVAAWRALDEAGKAVFRKRGKALGRTGYHLFVAEHLAAGGPGEG